MVSLHVMRANRVSCGEQTRRGIIGDSGRRLLLRKSRPKTDLTLAAGRFTNYEEAPIEQFRSQRE
jgi:hypothetical protein